MPSTPAREPVIPASVMYAVPPGRTRASAVGTCVCVPITAVTRPSRCQPIATFSLVASACMSTIRWSTVPVSLATSASASAKAERPADMKTLPERLMTPSRTPSRSSTVCPRPGWPWR